jgi:uncharacterized protein (DUF1778 family)
MTTKKRGRPPAGANRRGYVLGIRLTVEERDLVIEAAELDHKSASTWARGVINKALLNSCDW